MNRIQDIAKLEDIPQGTRIGLYGAGAQSLLLMRALEIRPDVTVDCVVDTHKEGTLEGHHILKPTDLAAHVETCDIMLVTVEHFTEISNTLESLDLDLNVAKADKTLFSRCSTVYLPSINQFGYRTIFVEVTSRCNMSCRFCHQPSMKRPKVDMDYGLFTEIVDQCKDTGLVDNIYLFGYGESLMHPDLCKMIEYCTTQDIEPRIVTNGALLTPKMYKDMIKAGLSSLYISFHNFSAEGYFYRHAHDRTSFTDYRQQLVDVIDAHQKLNPEARIIISYMLSKPDWITSEVMGMEGLVEDTLQAKDMLDGFFADFVEIAEKYDRPYSNELDRMKKAVDDLEENGMQQIIEFTPNTHMSFAPLTIDQINLTHQKKSKSTENFTFKEATGGYCSAISTPMIMSDGSFAPCCYADFSVGKMSDDTTIMDILEGRNYQELIKAFGEDRLIMQTCRECMGTYEPAQPVKKSA